MGLVSKLTGKESSSHTKHSNTDTSAPAFGNDSTLGGQQSTTTDETHRKKGMGEKVKEAVGLDPKHNDPKDAAWQREHGGVSGTKTSSTTGYEGAHSTGVGSSGTSSSYDQSSSSTTREGGLERASSQEHFPVGRQHHSDKYETREAAPVVAEHVHDEYTNIDKTREEELHDRTKVSQTVQPVRDERTEGLRTDSVDHGTEVHEHGQAGLDERTRAEMAANREKLQRETQSTRDAHTTEMSERPNVDLQERTKTVEEVVPVVEKDVYRPHETEHHKRVVNIHHEKPVMAGTSTNAPVSLKEWESQGHSVSGTNTSTRTRTGSSSSSSSSDEGTGRTGTTRRKKGLGEKVKEAVGMDPKVNDPKDRAFEQGNTSTTGSSSYGSSSNTNNFGTSTTGYDNTSNTRGGVNDGTDRHKGMGEKAKEMVGMDPKDSRDPRDQGYSGAGNTGNTGATGYGTANNNAVPGGAGTSSQDNVVNNFGGDSRRTDTY